MMNIITPGNNIDTDIENTHFDPIPKLPKLIIIDVSDSVDKFIKEVKDNNTCDCDIGTVISDIIEIIQIRKDAEYELAYDGYDHYASAPAYLEKDVTDYINARERFGRELIESFVRNQLYYNGYLYYQYKNLMYRGLVLEKLNVPYTSAQRKDNNFRRLIDSAWRKFT